MKAEDDTNTNRRPRTISGNSIDPRPRNLLDLMGSVEPLSGFGWKPDGYVVLVDITHKPIEIPNPRKNQQ